MDYTKTTLFGLIQFGIYNELFLFDLMQIFIVLIVLNDRKDELFCLLY